jgi:cell division septation protein DedD
MNTREFREIQVSSTLLVVIFLCVLVLGVFIFLLGVSVGKKQVQISAATRVVAQKIQEPEGGPEGLKPAPSADEQAKSESAALSDAGTPGVPTQAATGGEAAVKPPAKASERPVLKNEAKTPSGKQASAPSGAGLYYVQVATFKDRSAAEAEAARFREKGYGAIVVNPQASDKKILYRVRLGGFATRGQAAELLARLNEATKKKTDYWIVRD